MQSGAKFIAAERGAFEPSEAELEVIQIVPASPLVTRLTDAEVVMIFEFRKTLPVMV